VSGGHWALGQARWAGGFGGRAARLQWRAGRLGDGAASGRLGAASFERRALSLDDRALGGRDGAQSRLDCAGRDHLQSLRGSLLRSGLEIGQHRLKGLIEGPLIANTLSAFGDPYSD